MAEHKLKEELPEISQRLKKDIEFVSCYLSQLRLASQHDFTWRPTSNSTWNPQTSTYRMVLRSALLYMVLREMPIVNPWARAVIMFVSMSWFLASGVGRGLVATRPMIQSLGEWRYKRLLNIPDLLFLSHGNVVPSHFPRNNPHLQWKTYQTPVYHEYHRTTYRYRMRRPRYVPWVELWV